MWNLDFNFRRLAFEYFVILWQLENREESFISLLKDDLQLIVRFFDLIRSRKSERLNLSVFLEIGLDGDRVLDLCQVVQIHRGSSAIDYNFSNPDDCYVVYNG